MDIQDKALEIIHSNVLTDSSDRLLVTLTFAQTMNGIIGGVSRTPIQLSGPESSLFTHCLRYTHDAILIGISTLLSDSPQLTCRHLNLPASTLNESNPIPIIIDPRLRIPAHHYILSRNPIIVCLDTISSEKCSLLISAGARLIRCNQTTSFGTIDLKNMLQQLSKYDIKSLMVEGGATVIQNFINQRMYDTLVVTLCPLMYKDGVRIEYDKSMVIDASYHQFGKDIIVISRKLE